MTTTTHYSRDRDGHTAKTLHDLGNQRELLISTSKMHSGELVTRAYVHRVEGRSQIHVIGYGIDGDFSRKIMSSRPARTTVKVVQAQHEKSLEQLEMILEAVQAHYAAQAAQKATAHA